MNISLPDARELADDVLHALRLRALHGCEIGFTQADVAALQGWRREMFGEAALALKHGKLALAIEKGRVVRVDRQD